MRDTDTVRRFVIFFYEGGNFASLLWGILNLRKLLQTAMHWQNRLFLTFESLTIHLFFLDNVKQCYLQTKKHAVTS